MERDRIVAYEFALPDGSYKRFNERTVRKWIERFRKNGFDGLIDGNRKTLGSSRAIPAEILEEAEKLRRELSSRSVPQNRRHAERERS